MPGDAQGRSRVGRPHLGATGGQLDDGCSGRHVRSGALHRGEMTTGPTGPFFCPAWVSRFDSGTGRTQAFKPMTTITCAAALLLAVLTIPVMVLLYYTATPQQHAKRLRATGMTYKAIGLRLKVHASTARKYALA